MASSSSSVSSSLPSFPSSSSSSSFAPTVLKTTTTALASTCIASASSTDPKVLSLAAKDAKQLSKLLRKAKEKGNEEAVKLIEAARAIRHEKHEKATGQKVSQQKETTTTTTTTATTTTTTTGGPQYSAAIFPTSASDSAEVAGDKVQRELMIQQLLSLPNFKGYYEYFVKRGNCDPNKLSIMKEAYSRLK